MDRKDKQESRRYFISQIGLDAALLLLPAAGASRLQAQSCAVPGNPTNPTAFVRDCRSLEPRRPASTLTSSQVNQLKAAYQAMRALDTTDPADPRGFLRQANVHCDYCTSASKNPHGTLHFLPYHRAYLYYHERILGKLIGDMTFRLPYWDWENPSHRTIPPPYRTPNNSTNPLFNGTRAMDPADTLPAGDVDLSGVLSQSAFNSFSSQLEGGPHGSVHVDVGGASGDMSFFSTAGRDPVFYAHHANVDKAWTDWIAADSAHVNPSTAAWLNKSYTFFDENKNWRTITNAQVVNNEQSLRYYYGTRSFEFISWFCIRRWLDVTLVQTSGLWRFEVAVSERFIKAAEGGTMRLAVKLTGISLPATRSAVYNVYLSEQEAKENKGSDSSGYLGTLPVVLHSKEHKHDLSLHPFYSFDITDRAAKILSRREPVGIYLADRHPKAAKAGVLTLPVRAVSISAGEIG